MKHGRRKALIAGASALGGTGGRRTGPGGVDARGCRPRTRAGVPSGGHDVGHRARAAPSPASSGPPGHQSVEPFSASTQRPSQPGLAPLESARREVNSGHPCRGSGRHTPRCRCTASTSSRKPPINFGYNLGTWNEANVTNVGFVNAGAERLLPAQPGRTRCRHHQCHEGGRGPGRDLVLRRQLRLGCERSAAAHHREHRQHGARSRRYFPSQLRRRSTSRRRRSPSTPVADAGPFTIYHRPRWGQDLGHRCDHGGLGRHHDHRQRDERWQNGTRSSCGRRHPARPP